MSFRAGVQLFLANRKIRLLGYAANTERSVAIAQPAGDKQVIWRRSWTSNPGNSDIPGQPITRTMQIRHHRSQVRFRKQLSHRDFAPRQRIGLTQQVIVAVMRETANKTKFVGNPRELRHGLAEMNTWQRCGNCPERSSDFFRSMRLRIERINVSNTAAHPEKNHGVSS